MHDDFHEVAGRVLSHVLDAPPEQRTATLEQACNGNSALRNEVLSLLDSLDEDYLETPLVERERILPSPSAHEPFLPFVIDRYRLVELIASGGMGNVYRAVRCDGSFQHQVAIKLIRVEYQNAFIKRRFQIERQALARLQHSNIARLLDGRSMDDGTPYIVMEYVDGKPIDEKDLAFGVRGEEQDCP